MNCTMCGGPVTLVPSAAERAQKDVTDKSAKYYIRLFPRHSECELMKRDHPDKLEAFLKEKHNANNI